MQGGSQTLYNNMPMIDTEKEKRLVYLPIEVNIIQVSATLSLLKSLSTNVDDWNGDDGFLGLEEDDIEDWEGEDGFI